MTEPTRTEGNARRLAGALERHSDPRTVERLAAILDYHPPQLAEDIQALAQLMEERRPIE